MFQPTAPTGGRFPSFLTKSGRARVHMAMQWKAEHLSELGAQQDPAPTTDSRTTDESP